MSPTGRISIPIANFVPNPSAPTVTPTGGAAGSYSYKIVGVAADGTQTAASSAGSTSAGPTTLDASHYNTETWTDPLNAVTILIYRTAGGVTQGLIGSVAAGVQTFRDDGKVGDATTPSASNGTGVGSAVSMPVYAAEPWAWLYGTFVATVQIQATPDGSTWFNVGSAFTSGGYVQLPQCQAFRAKSTAYASGQPVGSMQFMQFRRA
jgi:hypothetical protein